MKRKKIHYTDEPLGKLQIIPDFLPPPAEMARMRAMVKVTMEFDSESLEYFKKLAKRYGTPYQRIIRKVVDTYVARHPIP